MTPEEEALAIEKAAESYFEGYDVGRRIAYREVCRTLMAMADNLELEAKKTDCTTAYRDRCRIDAAQLRGMVEAWQPNTVLRQHVIDAKKAVKDELSTGSEGNSV